jgi:hypothetical protein
MPILGLKGQKCEIFPSNMILITVQLVRATGDCGEFCYVLWATTVNLVVCCGPQRRIWLYAMGYCGGFGYALCATACNEVVQQNL